MHFNSKQLHFLISFLLRSHTKNDQQMIPPPTPPSVKMNNSSIVSKEGNLQTCDKFQEPPTPVPCGRHKCINVPFLVF